MEHTLEERVIAFAGIVQACKLVQQIARTGRADPQAYQASINSLLITEATRTEDVYGGAGGVATGLRELIAKFSGAQQHDMEITQYLLSLLHLERKLVKQPHYMQRISEGIDQARIQSTHFEPLHRNVIANLAGLYKDTVSQIPPKIMVSGEHGHLQAADNADKVRALLLAAIRSAILWRQCGGTRWQVLLQRKKMIAIANQLLNRIHAA